MKTLISTCVVILMSNFLFAQNDSIISIELNKSFIIKENQKYKLEDKDIYFQVQEIITEANLKPAQLKRPHPKVKVVFNFSKGAKRMEAYLWDWGGKADKDNFPLAWDKYTLSLTVKDSIYITINETKFEKAFFIKTGETTFIQNLEIRYREFRFDYDPAHEGKGYLKKMTFYVTQGREGKHLEIAIIDGPVEIEWFAYKLRFIKDVQEFVKVEVIRNE